MNDEIPEKRVSVPTRRRSVTFRVDAAILDFFRADGPGYQTRMRDVLDRYVRAAQRRRAKRP